MARHNKALAFVAIFAVVLCCTGATWIMGGKGSHGGAATPITRIQSTVGASSAAVLSVATANFGSSVTSGNLIVVVVRSSEGGSVTVTDTLGTTYTSRVTQSYPGNDPTMHIWSGVLSSSGTNAITVTWAGTAQYRWAAAIEYNPGSGTWSSPYDVSDGETGTGTTDIVSGALTPTQANVLLVFGTAQSAFATYTVGTDYTLVYGTIGVGGNNFGGVQDRIVSGSLSSYVSHMTSTSTANYSAVVAAFKN